MTIQGAISELQNLLGADDIPFYYKTAIKKVIETIMNALEREPSEDLISRAEAINKFCTLGTTLERRGKPMITMVDAKYLFVEIIENLPSADRPKGEWNDIGGVIRWGCSLCHYAYDQKFNFCPNCGADMRGDAK